MAERKQTGFCTSNETRKGCSFVLLLLQVIELLLFYISIIIGATRSCVLLHCLPLHGKHEGTKQPIANDATNVAHKGYPCNVLHIPAKGDTL